MKNKVQKYIDSMPRVFVIAAVVLVMLPVVACNDLISPTEPGGMEGAEGSEGSGEGAEGSEGSGSEAGESGVRYGINETFDEVQSGVRLILNYEQSSSTFVGTFENTTTGVLMRVRVEIHLSNGVEIGPTTPVALNPGETRTVTLSAAGQLFDWYTAHPEVG